MLKKNYRRFLYPVCKNLERYSRIIIFFFIKKFYPKFNPFRFFGLPAGWKTVASQTILASEEFLLRPPITLEKVSHHNFQLDKHVGYDVKIAVLPGGIQTQAAASITADGYLARNFTEQFTMRAEYAHKLFTFRKERFFSKIPHFDETVASLAADCSTNYYHWLFDVLPKIYLLSQAGIPISRYYAQTTFGFQRDSLRLLGVEKVIAVEKHPIISASKLVVMTFPCQTGISKWVCDYLKGRFPPGLAKRRLFISRRDASMRRIINEEECESILERFGFETVVPGQLTFEEQIAYFREAEVILAPHGAGLSNLVFAPLSAKVIEIYSPRSTCVCFWHLSNLLGMPYYYLRGIDDPSTYATTEPAHDHIKVDPFKLESTLKMALNS